MKPMKRMEGYTVALVISLNKLNKGGKVMEYTFEKLANEEMYQVRLNGEFVTYSSKKDSKKIDEILLSRGYKSRQEFFNDCMKDIPLLNKLTVDNCRML
jgi:hypothetical protein